MAAPSTPASARPRRAFDADLQKHLKGAIAWAAGQSDPAYSDCGATVLKNYQQVKVTQQPNLNEPIGFDQFPDGRIIQTDRRGGVRLHNPTTGTTQIIADLGDTTLPTTLRVYTNSEDGLYGPAVDKNFATNKWVYLYYVPADRHQRAGFRRLDHRLADDAERDGAERTPRTRRRGTSTSATSSSRASSSSRTPTVRVWT